VTTTSADPVRIGLVGYGLGGRFFHAPFIEAADGIDLVGVVTNSPERRAELAEDFPGMPVFGSLTELLAAGVDAVTITTPPQTRRELVLEAVAAGVPVVADKPFAPNAEAARALVAAAEEAGVPVSVFHNRRWDANIRTVQKVLEGRALGDLWSIESRFELDLADYLDRGPEGGLLRDLGAHLVDQMIWLLGTVDAVFCTMDWVDFPEGRTDAFFTIVMEHASGVRSTVTAGKLNRVDAREFRVYGSEGSYIARTTDVQAVAVTSGIRPVAVGDAWGYDDEAHWGTLSTSTGTMRVPSERGAYQDYYTQFAQALHGKAPFPVPAAEVIATLDVLDAARESEARGEVVQLVD
jgi:predicted dehydrogenase